MSLMRGLSLPFCSPSFPFFLTIIYRNMLDVSELEQELAVKDDHESAMTKVYNLLRDQKVKPISKVSI